MQVMIIQICGGIFLITLSLFVISRDMLALMVVGIVEKRLGLIDDSLMYKEWLLPQRISFSCHFFNVTNPDEVMRGENPNMVEYGPFTYDEIREKQVLDVDEIKDEIKYTTRSTYTFNKHKSVDMSNHEKVTVLNPAYIGTISTLASLPAEYMEKYGNNIPKLFPNRSTIFLTARGTDLLFEGVKVTCNLKKYPELNLVCKMMKTSPPPVLRATDREDVYRFSLFQRVNGTINGPFTVNRGKRNISQLGDISSYMGKNIQTVWSTESCNLVKGTDTITWAPMSGRWPYVSTFIPELCRTIEVDYTRDVSVHGITGYRYDMGERVWLPNVTQCYCPIVKDQVQCLPQGLLDVSECEKIPIFLSEPHFLHADPALLKYANGLSPNPKRHKTYIVIEPYTGTPLSGQKKIQVNLKLTKQPVELLSNVSEGFFPILWCENGNTPTLEVILFTYQILRTINLMRYLQYVPLVLGIYTISITLFLHDFTKRKVYTNTAIIHLNSRVNKDEQRPPRRSMFQ